MGDWSLWLGVFALICMALFSALNLALRMPSRARIAERFERFGRQEMLEQIVARRPRYMLATAVLRSISVFALFLSTGVFFFARGRLERPSQVVTTCVVAWALLLIFGIAIPYAWAKYRSDWLLFRFMGLLRVCVWFCYPIMGFVELFDPLVRRLSGIGPQDAESYAEAFEREILEVVNEGEIRGAVDEEQREMIHSVMELGDMRVQEIMTPRTDIVALPVNSDMAAVSDAIRRFGHSRVPVYDGTIDTILGILYIKDLLRRGDTSELNLRSIMRKAFFIPESKAARDLLREFQTQKVHMAVVLDEYGGTAGLISIEDILEELVGELADEYEPSEPEAVKQLDENTFEVDARVRIDELNDQLHLTIPDSQDYETIGGFVFATMGKIPRVGEHCQHSNIDIEVIGAEARRVTRLLLRIEQDQANAELEPTAA